MFNFITKLEDRKEKIVAIYNHVPSLDELAESGIFPSRDPYHSLDPLSLFHMFPADGVEYYSTKVGSYEEMITFIDILTRENEEDHEDFEFIEVD